MSARQRLNFWSKMALIGVWFAIATPLFAILALPLWRRSWLGWAYARVLSGVGLRVLGIRLDVRGLGNLDHRPAVIVANHQSNMDVLLLGAIYPRNTVVIGKRELLRVPFFGILFAASRNIMIDRRDRSRAVAGLDQAVRALREEGMSIWIFPEGTRSHGKHLGAFKKGAFHMAAEAGVPLIPVVTGSMARALDISGRRAPGGTVTIRVLEPIPTSGRALEQVVESTRALFSEQLAEMEGTRKESR